MTLITKFLKSKKCLDCLCKQQNPFNLLLRRYSVTKEEAEPEEKQEFRVLKLLPPSSKSTKNWKDTPISRLPDVELQDVDWTNIWVGPKSFDPYVFPVPIRQGYTKKGPPPDKYANAELMKIPNFLHLTPVAVKKHCEALKKFCTEWPEELLTEAEMEENFPVTVISSDYCNSLPTIRDPLSRIVTLKVKLSCFNFDEHAKDKFLRLVGSRYDPATDYVTLTTESCPTKKQNYDYAMYLLTALYFESWKVEHWESKKSDEDMEEYIFSERLLNRNLEDYFAYNKMQMPDISEVKQVMESILNENEDPDKVETSKYAVLKLIGLPKFK